jgi:hypothetical protein
MSLTLEEQKRKTLEPEKHRIEQVLEQFLSRTPDPTNRQKFLLREALDEARSGRFQLAWVAIKDFTRPESEWSPSAVVTDEMVRGIDRDLLLHRLAELKAMPPQWPPVFTDFVAWSAQQGALLRRIAAGEPLGNDEEVDWGNVIEEIESLGKNDQRDLASRIQTVLEHLIRLRASPAVDPRRGWERTLIVQRDGIHKLLADSPSLRPQVAGMIAAELPTARRLALLSLAEHDETPAVDVTTLTFSEGEVLG